MTVQEHRLLYEVTIGSDYFRVLAEDNQEARYTAANLFRSKHLLMCSLTTIACHASTRLVKSPSKSTTELLDLLPKDFPVDSSTE